MKIQDVAPGQIVDLKQLSKDSYYLYRKYEKFSKLMICPCKLNSTTLLEVVDKEEDVVILKVLSSDTLTVVYAKDLEAIYERD